MACKCGHEAKDHQYAPPDTLRFTDPRFPCVKCECRNYDMASDMVGF